MVNVEEAKAWLREDLRRIAFLLDLEPPKFVLVPWRKLMTFVEPLREAWLGLLDIRDREEFRKALIHGCLHAGNLRHDKTAEKLGFRNVIVQDDLSSKIYEWMFRGQPKPVELEVLKAKQGWRRSYMPSKAEARIRPKGSTVVTPQAS